MSNPFPHYPQQIKFSTERANLNYVRMEQLYSAHGGLLPKCADEVLAVLEEGEVVIYAGDPPISSQDIDPQQLTPVYALRDGGPAVPTGLVLVRFEEHLSAAEQQLPISAAGYVIEQVLPYAPHVAWVRSATGKTDVALNGVPRLEAIEHVVNVEPQLLLPPIARGAPARPV